MAPGRLGSPSEEIQQLAGTVTGTAAPTPRAPALLTSHRAMSCRRSVRTVSVHRDKAWQHGDESVSRVGRAPSQASAKQLSISAPGSLVGAVQEVQEVEREAGGRPDLVDPVWAKLRGSLSSGSPLPIVLFRPPGLRGDMSATLVQALEEEGVLDPGKGGATALLLLVYDLKTVEHGTIR